MNFIASSTTLLRHLQSISGVLNTSNTLPILDNFLFEITDGMLTVSISDLETTMMTKLEVQAEQNGKIAIPAKLLLDVLKSLPDQPCTFKVNSSNFQIEIAYDNGKSRMVETAERHDPCTVIVFPGNKPQHIALNEVFDVSQDIDHDRKTQSAKNEDEYHGEL